MSEVAVRVRGLSKKYGEKPVLRDIDAAVLSGETIAIVGPSGGGKTTFLRCLNGLSPHDAGTIEIASMLLGPGALPAAATLRRLRAQVGMVFQGFHLFPHLNVLDNVALAPVHVHGESRDASRDRALSLLARVGLSAHASAAPSSLSGGEQQRVAIARALAMRPKVLLLDEPTSALDPQMRDEVLAVLGDLTRDGRTMLVATHEMSFARRAASRVWVFDEGRLVEDGPPAEVCDRPRSPRARAFFSAAGDP